MLLENHVSRGLPLLVRVIFSMLVFTHAEEWKKTLVKIETQERGAMCKNVTALRDTEKVLFCGLTE